MHKFILSIILTFIFIFGIHLPISANDDNKPNSLNDYFHQCLKKLHLPEAEQMCDTLLWMAQKAGNSKMELNAARLKLDFYYFSSDEDHITNQLELVKKMCKVYGDPESYYFSWGNRLITFYIIHNQMNIALYEVNKMMKEAQQEDYKPGIAECFRSFAIIYQTQSAYQLAVEYFQKEIDIYEKENIVNHNLPVEYSSLAQCAIKLGWTDIAQKAIEKGEKHIEKGNSYQVFTILKAKLYLYLHQNAFNQAWDVLKKMAKICNEDKEMQKFIDGLYDGQFLYYQATKQYDKALAFIDTLTTIEPYCSSAYSNNSLHMEKGNIFWETKQYFDAAKAYREYIEGIDTLTTQSLQSAISEFNAILNVELLQKEKGELLLDVQKKQLYVTYVIIGFMFVLLLVGWYFYIRIYRLNGKLKTSEVELRNAKTKAEQSSIMKSEFINNMSHEIRTPLNSIVGFSQVLSESNDKPEMKEYADIITKNSSDLLRLIHDVLDLSSLDQSEDIPYNIPDDINNSCNESIALASEFVKNGVELQFAPSCLNLIINTNPNMVTKILTQLLHNAAKFTNQGKITLDYVVADKQIIYSVTDTGIGIPEDKQEYIFERFAKINNFSQGTGLGLSLCKLIAEKLGGNLAVDKNYTGGCRFILALPYSPFTLA